MTARAEQVAIVFVNSQQSQKNTMDMQQDIFKTNPLLAPSGNPFGAPAFDKIKTEDYKPAFEAAVEAARQEVDAICANPQEPTFANTIEALERAGEALGSVSAIFFNLNEACTDPRMQSIAEEVTPMLTAHTMYVTLNPVLFSRIKTVWDGRDRLDLNPEQARLLEQAYKSFARSGANLADKDKEQFSAAQEKLQLASLSFDKNALDATNAFTLEITDEADLKDMPAYAIDAAAAEAAGRGVKGWVFTLDAPSYSAFMAHSTRRSQREAMWRAYNTRALGGKFDNSGNIRQIVLLREQIARLLGYKSYSYYALEERMAKNPETVNAFLADLMAKTRPFALKEMAQLREYAASKGCEGEIMPWDFSYWSRRQKEDKYAITTELLKPYFELGKVRQAIFDLAGALYGVTFSKRSDIPVYHPDVEVYEVRDAERFMGLLYMDFFPRASKRSGAWMTNFREQSIRAGEQRRPFVSLVTNFTKPVGETPSLLTFGEVTTLLHEFGHSLHSLLSEGTYASLTGTNVTRDFVELPSQLMENWAYESEFLDSFARHYITGETIPREYIDRIIAAKNYQAGYSSVRQLQFGLLDMAWHSGEPLPEESVAQFEAAVGAPGAVLPIIDGTAMSTSFTHIFSGGYSAGYYSYKWAEVLAADAFAYFKETGIFNRGTAESFRREILSRGDIEDADVLYRNWRGRDARPEALLESDGLVPPASESD